MKYFTSKNFFSALTVTSNASCHWTAIQVVILLLKMLFDLVIRFQCSAAAAAAAAGSVGEKLDTNHRVVPRPYVT